jgi:hypothetical protein
MKLTATRILNGLILNTKTATKQSNMLDLYEITRTLSNQALNKDKCVKDKAGPLINNEEQHI